MGKYFFYWLVFQAPMLMAQNFVTVRNAEFFLEGRPYSFIGTNFWYGMHLGAEHTGDRSRLVKELDQLVELGLRNLRIMACSEGPDHAPWRVQPPLQPEPEVYDEDLLGGLDFLLVEMSKRKMRAVVCLNNFWPWTGGMAQYQAWTTNEKIPYPPPEEDGSWLKYMLYATKFYTNAEAMTLFEKHIHKIVSRVNQITNVPYKEDPTIMAWQLANEPRGITRPNKYRSWIRQSAKYIKSMDANHLVSVGSEGNTPSRLSGNRFLKDHLIEDIDYTTVHIWVQNWMWYDPLKPEDEYEKALIKVQRYLLDHVSEAKELNKPLVLEEFGMSRDFNNHDPAANTIWRDRYFRQIFSWVLNYSLKGELSGCNFWAWGGYGRPTVPETIWKKGDDLIGDPPHEHQGWYSVYDMDYSTQEIIKEFTGAISRR